MPRKKKEQKTWSWRWRWRKKMDALAHSECGMNVAKSVAGEQKFLLEYFCLLLDFSMVQYSLFSYIRARKKNEGKKTERNIYAYLLLNDICHQHLFILYSLVSFAPRDVHTNKRMVFESRKSECLLIIFFFLVSEPERIYTQNDANSVELTSWIRNEMQQETGIV